MESQEHSTVKLVRLHTITTQTEELSERATPVLRK